MDVSQANDKKWTHQRKLLLITTRLRYESDFTANKKKRNTIWETILREIKDIDDTFPFTRDEITRCFLNIMITYKRIRKRNNTSGESATNWEYFNQLDEVYGTRSSVCVPDEMTERSLENLTEILTSDNPLTVDEASSNSSTPVGTSKRRRNEVLDFLKEESEKDQATTEKLFTQENERLEVEKEKLSELRKIRELFEIICQSRSNNN